MNFINEDAITAVIDLFESSEESFYKASEEIITDQLAIGAAITEENLSILSDDEYDLLWFLVVVIYKAIDASTDSIPTVKPKVFESIEEKNWNQWNEIVAKGFKEKLDKVFENYFQEDLLAFVEDSLASDDDISISNESQEVIFITCKSIIDSFNQTLT